MTEFDRLLCMLGIGIRLLLLKLGPNTGILAFGDKEESVVDWRVFVVY